MKYELYYKLTCSLSPMFGLMTLLWLMIGLSFGVYAWVIGIFTFMLLMVKTNTDSFLYENNLLEKIE